MRIIKFNKKTIHYSVLVAIGLLIGYALSLIPQPLLSYVIYKDAISGLLSILISIPVAILLMLTVGKRRHVLFDDPRKKVYRMLSIGISCSSFFLAFYTFMNYPTMLASNGYGWLTGGTEWHIGVVNMSSIAFFIASITWDTLVGSLFAVIEHVLT